eukprot:m.177234 g.177234  ORF g.177234 m.177234 type:complete len:464 (-) comp17376_c0_seq1:167-1558(-)
MLRRVSAMGPAAAAVAVIAVVAVLLADPAAIASAAPASDAKPVPPIVFVPGLTESKIQERTDHSPLPSVCKQDFFWKTMWPSKVNDGNDFLCFMTKFSTFFDPAGPDYQNFPGVETRVLPGALGIEVPLQIVMPYVKSGFKVGESFFVAPYDWRKPGFFVEDYFASLQEIVERAYAVSQGQRVTLLAVSFGPQYALAFLNSMSQEWKDKYIAWFVAESPLWSGAPETMSSFASGLSTSPAFIRYLSTSIDSLMWIFPRPGTSNDTFHDDEVIISTPSRNYTAFDAAQLVRDLGYENRVQSLQYMQNVEPVLNKFEAPGVDMLVTYGYGLGTPLTFVYEQDFVRNQSVLPPQPNDIINATETGDVFVPLRSSLRSLQWAGEQSRLKKQLLHRGFYNQYHGMCFLPSKTDSCFHQIVALVQNGTIPPPEEKEEDAKLKIRETEQALPRFPLWMRGLAAMLGDDEK